MNYTEEYKDCLDYIDSYWDKVTYKPAKRKIARRVINVPYHFITPNHSFYNTIFYWDTYFIFRGLMGTKRAWLMKHMVDNFIYLFNMFDIMPNSNDQGRANRSQPPFFTSMILDAYQAPHRHHRLTQILEDIGLLSEQKQWLKNAMETAKKEYLLVWLDLEGGYNHRVEGYGLARYGDRDIGYAHSSELESGWDFTSRFYNRCNDFLPIDLNVFLYRYEKDFASIAPLFEEEADVEFWNQMAENRKKEINKYMWNEKKGFFFDFGYGYKQQSEFLSLAGFTPMWVGLASYEQAQKMVQYLATFETEHGLVITAKESLARPIDLSTIQKRYHPAIHEIIDPKQWDYPHMWAPLEYLTVIGLLRYGFIDSATRIMQKSLKTNANIFRKYGTLFEKINGVTGDKTGNYNYETQLGFGWTNAVFYRYIEILNALNNNEDIYRHPKPEKPPYQLSILH